MNLRDLQYFVALAEELHFARAAERVGINQSPLSKAITQLELSLGVRLFIRTRRRTTLTGAGEMLLRDARRILIDVEQARRNLSAIASGHSGRLQIALCVGIAHPKIGKLIAGIRRDYPDVDVRVTHSSCAEQLRDLRKGTLDVGIVLNGPHLPKTLTSVAAEVHATPLWQEPAVAVVRPDHALASQRMIKRIDATAGPLILLGERSGVGAAAFEEILRSVEPKLEVAEYVASIEMLLTLVAADYGVGLLSSTLAKAIRRPDVITRRLSICGTTITTFLLRRSDDESKLVEQFTERALTME